MHCLKHFTWQDEDELLCLGCADQGVEVWQEGLQTWIIFLFLPLAVHFLLCFLPSVSELGRFMTGLVFHTGFHAQKTSFWYISFCPLAYFRA